MQSRHHQHGGGLTRPTRRLGNCSENRLKAEQKPIYFTFFCEYESYKKHQEAESVEHDAPAATRQKDAQQTE